MVVQKEVEWEQGEGEGSERRVTEIETSGQNASFQW